MRNMPVLSDSSSSSPSSSNLNEGFKDARVPCGNVYGAGIRILGAGVILCCFMVLFLRRRNLKTIMASKSTVSEEGNEYQAEKKTVQSLDYETQYSEQQPLLPSQASQEPTLFETNLTNVRNLESVPASPISTYLPSSSPEPIPASEATSSTTATSGLKIDIPRRRSYTKTIVSGGAEIVEVELNGEIIVSPEGWRRHTRVFGGGVCKACEESEKRLSA